MIDPTLDAIAAAMGTDVGSLYRPATSLHNGLLTSPKSDWIDAMMAASGGGAAGELGAALAYAQAAPIPDLIAKISSDAVFAAYYKIFTKTAVMSDRLVTTKLTPSGIAGYTWAASGGKPSGTISASSEFGPSNLAWMCLDDSAATYWYPASSGLDLATIDVTLGASVMLSSVKIRTVNNNFRPQRGRFEVAAGAGTWQSAGDYDVPLDAMVSSGGNYDVAISIGSVTPCDKIRMTVLQHTAGSGYVIFDLSMTGVIL